ncbi:PaeR7I family type II restriction endonuclease [Tundrisphaera lichenicola]|uniref:PaeR7I family type II restriction endonuclease n=1 Tax=Tundrisphaera lichenicola TaxID=2029860 RepID=UPI003EBA5B6A
MSRVDDLNERLRGAVRHFWSVRGKQAASQGGGGEGDEARDRGGRSAVTGGKQMDGFVLLMHDLLVEAGLESSMVYCSTRSGEDDESDQGEATDHKKKAKRKKSDGPRLTQTQLPGWFRAEKDWDLLVIVNGMLVAAIEFKTQVGSFGNNFNNRTEEALGNAADIKAAYREGAFKPSLRPWLGYLMLLENSPKSTRPVKPVQPHFKVFPEFLTASYAKRYDILMTKLVREELYDAACFLLSPQEGGLDGECTEPNPELSFRNFVASLVGHASAIARMHPAPAESAQPSTREETKQDQ